MNEYTVSAERIAAPFGKYDFENTTVFLLTVGGLSHYYRALETHLDHRLPWYIYIQGVSKRALQI
jgi:hypothetical protein